jgi:hypothetical protein
MSQAPTISTALLREDVLASPLGQHPQPDLAPDELAVLQEIQRRVLWLSTLIVRHANRHYRIDVMSIVEAAFKAVDKIYEGSRP